MSISPAEFYRTMYTDSVGWWHATAIDSGGARMLGTFEISDDIEAMLSTVEFQDDDGLYVVAAACADRVSGGRTTGDDAVLIPFLWLDADATHGIHQTDDGLLRDLGHLNELLAGFPLAPTAVVDSGGGWYPMWKLAEPIDAQADGQWWLDRWETTWQRYAAEFGVHLDRTSDLSRLLRMVGSVNTKFPEGSRPVVQAIFLDPARQYGLDDLDEVLDLPVVRKEPVELNPRRPGDDYSMQATVADLEALLAEIGMRDFRDGRGRDRRRFSRPSKPGAVAGSIFDDADALRVVFWSSDGEVTNHSIEPRKSYAAFQLRTLIRQRSLTKEAFTATVAELRTEGYAEQPRGFEGISEPVEPLLPDLRFNDIDNSTRFVHLHGDRIRYVIEWGTWIVWDGTRWLVDRNKVAVYELAKSVSSALYRQAAGEDSAAAKQTAAWANRSATRGQIAAMVDLARGIEGVVISHTELDTDPWLLGVQNGYIDLRAGTFHKPDPTKLMTMQTLAAYDPDAEAPRWAQALVEWFPDEPLREAVQRLSGHALSGDPLGDHIFVIQHGDGRNGKGTFNRAHKHVLGPYFVTPDKSLLIQKRHDEHATVKARLFRTRLAVASETEQRERLNEAQVKNLTGRDPINARRMREDEWEFEPTHSLWLQTNHLPEVTGSDNGMWSRIRVVPFTETFTGRGDPELDTTLAGESAGILNWMIEGCLQWQRIGLKEPETVVRATLDYRNSEDVLTRFATDTGLQFAKNTTLIDAELKAAITQWAAEEGVDKPNAKKTNAWMKANGCRESRENYTKNDGKTSKRKIWKGAALPRPGASPSESAETQANTEENPLPGRTGPTPPVNPPMVPRVETNRTTTSSASHRDGESDENPTPAGERARNRAR